MSKSQNTNPNLTNGVLRVFGEVLKISMGATGEPAFSKSAFRRAINEAIDYLVNGGQLGLAGKVYSIPRISLEITAIIGAEAPPETWGILMARQQGIEKVDVTDIPKPDANSFYTGNKVGDVSRETVRDAIKDVTSKKLSPRGPFPLDKFDGEPTSAESPATSEGPGTEEGHVPGVAKETDPLSRF